jgi:hypothetical protein
MRCLAAALLMAAVAVPASAQSLKMSFSDGKVSLDATQVPVRTILAEWARLGGTKVVNGEKITGSPLTLKLVDTPESQALEIILRNVAGYMAAPRAAATGASLFDRILVMPTSSAPANAAAATPTRPATPANNAGTQRFIPPRPVPAAIAGDEDEAPPEAFDPSAGQPVFQFPQPQGQPGANIFQPAAPGTNIFQPAGQPTPFGTPVMPQGQQGISVNPTPAQPPGTMVYPVQPPTGGFGVFGAPTPGMIQQPPPAPQPGVTVIRPPGR